jgi:prephenate dehydratase
MTYDLDVFDITQSGATTYGVVPFENSSNGSVVFTLDYFADRSNEYADLNVCREIYFDVHHCLLGHIAPSSPPPLSSSSSTIPASSTTILTPKSNEKDANKEEEEEEKGSTRSRSLHPLSHVRRVYSHPQAFGQCAAFLGSWLKGIETIDVSSTSRAAELALADASGESAAISSAVAAELLGLDVLARNIEDRDDNTTRFFVLRKGTTIPASPSAEQEQEQEQGEQGEKETTKPNNEKVKPEEEEDDDAPLLSSTKSLLSFTVPHRSPGALADVLSCFRRGGLNLTSINNRPSHAGPFEYVFFVEFEGHRFRDPRGRVAGVLRDVANLARTWRWLGSWESMRKGGAMAVVR